MVVVRGSVCDGCEGVRVGGCGVGIVVAIVVIEGPVRFGLLGLCCLTLVLDDDDNDDHEGDGGEGHARYAKPAGLLSFLPGFA